MSEPQITFTVTDPDVNALASLVELLDSVGCLGDEKVRVDSDYVDSKRHPKVEVTMPIGVIQTDLADLYADAQVEE